MSVTKIDRATLNNISGRIEQELKALSDKLGVDIAYKGGQYSNGGTGMVKLELTVRDTGTGKSGAQIEFENYAPLLDIDPKAFGQKVMVGNRIMTICGVNPGSPKYRFSAKTSDGKVYKITADPVRRAFPAKKAA